MVGCSQCGQSFGAGDSGYSACSEHRRRQDLAAAQRASTAAQAAAKAESEAYTQGQLRAGLPTVDGVAFRNRLHTTDGRLVALVFGLGTDDGEANTTRLAACWNACAGIPTAALELCGTCIDTPEQGEHL